MLSLISGLLDTDVLGWQFGLSTKLDWLPVDEIQQLTKVQISPVTKYVFLGKFVQNKHFLFLTLSKASFFLSGLVTLARYTLHWFVNTTDHRHKGNFNKFLASCNTQNAQTRIFSQTTRLPFVDDDDHDFTVNATSGW